MAVFLVFFGLFWTYDLCIEAGISEMAACVLLIFYSMITFIPGLVHIFSESKKVENWRFYDCFSYFFFVGFELKICVLRLECQRWLYGFIWYVIAWCPTSQDWYSTFQKLKKIKIGDFTAIFLIIFSLDFRLYKHIQRQCSEMGQWILLKLYSNMPSYPEMISMFSDFEKVENLRFYSFFRMNFDLDLRR